ncbi:uncharacterized protein BP5553_04585 [Venustampulla echinocandica]|uniref:DNA (cytosine-5-)-methyltransferase n=1 Tax=Venustampulla echinocandica TaxID=2656787 RepID=A0A370TNQ0_9HELO|nr:uncharacterized protein BP5553_04585 [Venustampulla echinocandica]RDL37152.1 hypothetical protein BP5553_04585 [Venustampulla echinocandica]
MSQQQLRPLAAGSSFESPLLIDSDEDQAVSKVTPRNRQRTLKTKAEINSSQGLKFNTYAPGTLVGETDREDSDEDIRGPIRRMRARPLDVDFSPSTLAAESPTPRLYRQKSSLPISPGSRSLLSQTSTSPTKSKRQPSSELDGSPSKRYQPSDRPATIVTVSNTNEHTKTTTPNKALAYIPAHAYIEISDDDSSDENDKGDYDGEGYRRSSLDTEVEGRNGQTRIQNRTPAQDNYWALSSDTEAEDQDERRQTSSMPVLQHKRRAIHDKQRSSPIGGNLDEEVLKHRIQTKATPWIRKLAGAMFNRTLGAAEAEDLDDNDKKAVISITSDVAIVRKAAWDSTSKTNEVSFEEEQIWYESATGRTGFPSVEIDYVRYCPGDFCIVRPSENTEASEQGDPWFARIISIFEEEDGEPSCHMQWLVHGSSTILGETAGPHELFLLYQCDNNPATCIAGKIQVDLPGDERQDFVTGAIETRYNAGEYFCRFVFDDNKETFTHAPSLHDPLPKGVIQGKDCYCCLKIQEVKHFNRRTIIGNISKHGSITGYEYLGVTYHVHDFVYIVSKEAGPYVIGQILAFKVSNYLEYSASPKLLRDMADIRVTVKVLERYHDKDKKWWKVVTKNIPRNIRDNRRLYLTKKEIQVSADLIEGRCQVRHPNDIDNLDTYKDQNDTFWIKDQVSQFAETNEFDPLHANELMYCEDTKAEIADRESKLKDFLASTQALPALELCAGCGGLCLGLGQSGAIKTKWAVEFAPAAARTFKSNFPDVQVYNEDGSKCLARAIRESQGIVRQGEKDIAGRPVSPMPKRGQVGVICGGFPCPGYTGANQRPLADDVKNTLITMVLSYVDFYRPNYVLLENVRGILTHRLGAIQKGNHKVEGGIERGTLKFILRALTSMGYACQFTVLQTGEFSVPQSRQRVFFWAAFRGNDLPKYPQATSIWAGACPVSWHRDRTTGVAPHREVTVGDATTDLPAFDWENPHNIRSQTGEQRRDREARSKTIIQLPIVRGKDYVGVDKQDYAYPPLTEYQRVLRRGVPADRLMNHVTHNFFDNPPATGRLRQAISEQVCNIEMIPGADHRGLPRKLRHWGLSHRDSAAERHNYYPGRYGRLDYEGPFQTCMTNVFPNGKNGNVVHPTQHRILSIREQARAMGFPDSYVWDLEDVPVKLAFRMIGNAVPVVLASKLGEELLEARFQAWAKARL